MTNQTENRDRVAGLISRKVTELNELAKEAVALGLDVEVEINGHRQGYPVAMVRVWCETDYLKHDGESAKEYPLPESPVWTTGDSEDESKQESASININVHSLMGDVHFHVDSEDGIKDIESKLIDSLLRVANSGARAVAQS